jgi:methionyl-tRNA formyltransferase
MGRMMNILFCFYRDWAESIYHQVKHESSIQKNINFDFVKTDDELNKLDIKKYSLIFFIGWSTIIKEDVINSVPCICLHPSKLPYYRGGSPIQNQIMDGLQESHISLFLMDSGIDTGDILRQVPFSLSGDLSLIFSEIINKSYHPILSIIEEFKKNGKFINRIKQDDQEATFYKRRTKRMSEITTEDIENYTALELHNKVRCLQDPYPNAFIKCKDGTVLYITRTRLDNT